MEIADQDRGNTTARRLRFRKNFVYGLIKEVLSVGEVCLRILRHYGFAGGPGRIKKPVNFENSTR